MHYFAEYLMAIVMTIPVTIFRPTWYSVHLEYSSWRVIHEVVIVVMGTLMNSLIFFIMMVITWI